MIAPMIEGRWPVGGSTAEGTAMKGINKIPRQVSVAPKTKGREASPCTSTVANAASLLQPKTDSRKAMRPSGNPGQTCEGYLRRRIINVASPTLNTAAAAGSGTTTTS